MRRIVTILAVIALLLPAVSCHKDDTPSVGARDEYVDLGLPSGTLWKATSEDPESRGITFYQAYEYFDPDFDRWITREDAEELIEHCTFTKHGSRVRVTGANKKSIEIVNDMIWTSDDGGPDVKPYCLVPGTPTIGLAPESSRHHIHLIKRPAN